MDFIGKNVIITGGASGIGRAVTNGVIESGGTAIIVDINTEAAESVQKAFGSDRIYIYKADMSNPDEIRRVFSQIIHDLGQIHILINSAGIVSKKPFENISQEEWDRVISINLTGVFASISSVYLHMVQKGYGRIVNVASVAGKIGGGLLGTSAYAASKAGVIGLTKAVAREGAAKSIACNAVCPAMTMTPMILSEPEETQNRIKAAIPMKRGAQPREVANVILFYASDLASFVTGEISDVDGGITMDG